MTPRDRLLLLAGSLYDLFPLPETATGKIAKRELRGLTARRQQECGCEHGWRTDRYRRRLPCARCGGRTSEQGEQVAGRGFVWVDDYDREQRPVVTGDTTGGEWPVARLHTEPCQFCLDGVRRRSAAERAAKVKGLQPCSVCDGTGRRPVWRLDLRVQSELSDGDRERALVEAIVRRDRAGDWAALERQLGVLRGADRAAYRRFVAVAVVGDGEPADPFEFAVSWLLARMPVPIRVPAELVRAAREVPQLRVRGRGLNGADVKALAARDRELRRRFDGGLATLAELVRLSGLSPSQVRRVVYEPRERSVA